MAKKVQSIFMNMSCSLSKPNRSQTCYVIKHKVWICSINNTPFYTACSGQKCCTVMLPCSTVY